MFFYEGMTGDLFCASYRILFHPGYIGKAKTRKAALKLLEPYIDRADHRGWTAKYVSFIIDTAFSKVPK